MTLASCCRSPLICRPPAQSHCPVRHWSAIASSASRSLQCLTRVLQVFVKQNTGRCLQAPETVGLSILLQHHGRPPVFEHALSAEKPCMPKHKGLRRACAAPCHGVWGPSPMRKAIWGRHAAMVLPRSAHGQMIREAEGKSSSQYPTYCR